MAIGSDWMRKKVMACGGAVQRVGLGGCGEGEIKGG